MAYNTLKSNIQSDIKNNTSQNITGQVLQDVLIEMVDSLGAGYQFMGVATPATNPGIPDEKVFYVAWETGTYTNFNGTTVSSGEIAVLIWDQAWSKQVLNEQQKDKFSKLTKMLTIGKWWIADIDALSVESATNVSKIRNIKVRGFIDDLAVTITQLRFVPGTPQIEVSLSFATDLLNPFSETVTLPEMATTGKYTFSNRVCSIEFEYTTTGIISQTLAYDFPLMVDFTQSPFISSSNFMQVNIIKRVEIGANVESIVAVSMKNYTGGTYAYYNVYNITTKDGHTFQKIVSDTSEKSGIVIDNLADVKIWVDATLLRQFLSRYTQYSPLLTFNVANCFPMQSSTIADIKNDMLHDGIGNLPDDVQIFRNGTASASNYGLPNTRYVFTLPSVEKLRIFFRYRLTGAVPYISNNTPMNLFRLGASGEIRGNIWRRVATNEGGYVYEPNLLGLGNRNISSASFVTGGLFYKPLNGKAAFRMRFTGDISQNGDLVMVMTSSYISIKHSGGEEVSRVNFSSDESVDELISDLNNVADIEATSIQTVTRTCGELVSNDSLEIPLVDTFAASGGGSYTDAPNVYIPYAWDKTYHTVECLVDMVNHKSYCAFDGMTMVSDFESITDLQCTLGGVYNGAECPIEIRDLEINLGNYKDAEIVEFLRDPYNPSDQRMLTQIVSDHNPRLILLEGHGVHASSEALNPTSSAEDQMAASTDRLAYVFDYLASKGYVPVTYQQIIDWKLNGKPLPKRCYNLMFDDWRWENYVDYAKRYPFIKANVGAGLAVFTENRQRDEQITIDGVTYTLGEIVDMTILGGWYPCSHTNDHRHIENDTPSQLPAKLKADIQACEAMGIYANVLVYPYGSIDADHIAPIMYSDFAIGITVTSSHYNQAAMNDFFFTRVDVGSRTSLDAILSQIV